MYSTATTIAGVCPLTQIDILLHTKGKFCNSFGNLNG